MCKFSVGEFGQNSDRCDYDFHYTHTGLVNQLINNDKTIPPKIGILLMVDVLN